VVDFLFARIGLGIFACLLVVWACILRSVSLSKRCVRYVGVYLVFYRSRRERIRHNIGIYSCKWSQMKLWLAVGMLRDSESWSIRAVARVQYLHIHRII
jgi:hypothetical protein